ncbi:MAG: hypothetical protein ABIR94_10940 [Rubrivivax sp.]
MRWDSGQGGPASAADALQALKLRVTKRTKYTIEYFNVTPPEAPPPGFSAIMRRRLSGDEAELTFKLRGTTALADKPSLKHWACPLPRPQKRKDESDITFMGPDDTRKAWSRSCTHESADRQLQVPAALAARPKDCTSTMTRLEAGKLKVEQWRMGDGSTLLEASHVARDTPADLAAFRNKVLTPLLASGIRPLDRSKSSIGGDGAAGCVK